MAVHPHWHKEIKKVIKDLRYEHLKGAKLLELVFPDFWINACRKKNYFYVYVFTEAKQHVDKRRIGDKNLKKDSVMKLWERHCDFCFKKITTEIDGSCFCTEDCYNWICAECFHDLKEEFLWQATKVQDIPSEGVAALEVKIDENI